MQASVDFLYVFNFLKLVREENWQWTLKKVKLLLRALAVLFFRGIRAIQEGSGQQRGSPGILEASQSVWSRYRHFGNCPDWVSEQNMGPSSHSTSCQSHVAWLFPLALSTCMIFTTLAPTYLSLWESPLVFSEMSRDKKCVFHMCIYLKGPLLEGSCPAGEVYAVMVKAEKCSTHSDVLPSVEELSLTLMLIWKHLVVDRETDYDKCIWMI